MTEAIRQGDIPGVQLRCRQSLPVDVDAGWALLASATSQERWLCPRAIADPSPGGAVEWTGNDEFADDAVERGETLVVDPPARWVLALRQPEWTVATRLEFELTPLKDGCELSVLHNGFEHLPLSASLTVWEAYRRHWRGALDRLRELAAK